MIRASDLPPCQHQISAGAADEVLGRVDLISFVRPQKRVHYFVLDRGRIALQVVEQEDAIRGWPPQSTEIFAVEYDAGRGVEPNPREVSFQPTARLDLIPERAQDWTVIGYSLPKAHDVRTTGGEGEYEQQAFHALSIPSASLRFQPNPLPQLAQGVE